MNTKQPCRTDKSIIFENPFTIRVDIGCDDKHDFKITIKKVGESQTFHIRDEKYGPFASNKRTFVFFINPGGELEFEEKYK